MARRKRTPVEYYTRYSYAPTYGRGFPAIVKADEKTQMEKVFDFAIEHIQPPAMGAFRFVIYHPGTDVVIGIEEHMGSIASALRYLDNHHNLFLKLEV